MAIDLNKDWGDADVAALLASVEDDRDWRLEVDQGGVALLHDCRSGFRWRHPDGCSPT